MNIIVNAQPYELTSKNVASALRELGFDNTVVATALNGEFVACDARAQTLLKDDDRLEVLTPMQGG